MHVRAAAANQGHSPALMARTIAFTYNEMALSAKLRITSETWQQRADKPYRLLMRPPLRQGANPHPAELHQSYVSATQKSLTAMLSLHAEAH